MHSPPASDARPGPPGPRQRLLAAMTGRAVDRVPLVLEGFHFARREEIDALDDPARREIAHRIFDRTHYFVHAPTFVNRYLVTPRQRIREVSRVERGGRVEVTTAIDTPRGTLTAVTVRNALTRTTWTVKYPCESLADIEAIRSVPWELPAGLAPARAPGGDDDGFARRGIVRAGVSSPFVCVAGMMPYQYFLELCATHFELIRELTGMCLERILAVLDVVLAGGAVEYVWMGGSEWLTPPMGSPQLYRRLVHDYERPIIERIHRAGAVAHVHCHGNVRATMEWVIERGADFLEPMEPPPDGDITLAEAKKIAAGRITLGGNVEARILENGTPGQVEAAVRAAFEGGRERMVLQNTAGPIGPVTPRMRANYHRMIDVWERLAAAG